LVTQEKLKGGNGFEKRKAESVATGGELEQFVFLFVTNNELRLPFFVDCRSSCHARVTLAL
jgi:hypothetical protein